MAAIPEPQKGRTPNWVEWALVLAGVVFLAWILAPHLGNLF
jgi:hypothetical protein